MQSLPGVKEQSNGIVWHLCLLIPRVFLMCLTVATALLLTAGLVQARPVTVIITDLEQLGSIEGDGTWGDFYAHVTINGTVLSNFGDHVDYDLDPFATYLLPSGPLLSSPWVLSLEVPDELETVAVRIEIIDHDSFSDDDLADINPTAKSRIDLVVDVATGKWTGDVNWPQVCTAGPPNADNAARICFDINVISASGDADEDGLSDNWEQKGVDLDHDGMIDIDLPGFGANPFRKDVFVEIDYLVAVDHVHSPRQDSIADIVQAYANAPVPNLDGTSGVQLHVDVGPLYGAGPGASIAVPGTGGVNGNYGNFFGGGHQIPEDGNEVIESFHAPKGNGTPFSDLKASYFDSTRSSIFRYAIFGHQTNARRATNDCSSGEADAMPGHDFMVTLGGRNANQPGLPPCWGVDAGGFSVGNRNEQAGTFMHELGHTLGLLHGGFEGAIEGFQDAKVNYLSVMSYRTGWQMCGVPASLTNPGLAPGGCDYSRIELPTLNENITPDGVTDKGLDECLGFDGGLLGFGPANWDADFLNGLPVIEGFTNCQPPNSANVKADIDSDGLFTLIKGYDDWGHLNYIQGLSGTGGGVPVENEPDPETIEEGRQFMSALLAPDIVVDKSGPATGLPGDVLDYTTEIKNLGKGPAVSAVLTDTAPDESVQTETLGVIKLGEVISVASTFTVPADACPGDFTEASASVAFLDIVGQELTASGTAPLQIMDVSSPTLTVTMSPSILWPPNHTFQQVTATIEVIDNCDPNPQITLVSVTSSEPESGYIGVGDKGPDINGADIGTDDRSFKLRAERATAGQSPGRVYTIIYNAIDASGNTSQATATVTVPRNLSRR